MNAAAVIGCGVIGRKRAEALIDLGIPLRALYDVDRGQSEQLAADLGGDVTATRTIEESAAAEGVDFAVIATPHDSLAQAAIAALEAGCDVLIEKPGAKDLSALSLVADAARRTGRRVRVGYNLRFHPAVREARQIISDGEFGPVMSIRGRYGHGARVGYEREWRTDPVRAGGGELVDQASHLIDLTRHLAGDVKLAFAELRTDFWDIKVEDNAYVALRTDQGAFAWLHASWTEWKNNFEVEIALRTARLDLRGLGGSYGPERLVVHAMRPQMGPPETSERGWDLTRGDDPWRVELADIRDELEGAPTGGPGLDDARAVLEVIAEAYQP